NETVEIMLDGQSLGSVTADQAGAWQITTTPGAGTHTVSINGGAENHFEINDTGLNITIDTIDTEGDHFVASGTAPHNAAVEVYLNGNLAGRVDADENGNWTFEAVAQTGANSLRASAIGAENSTQINSFDTEFVIGNGQPTIAVTAIGGANGQAQFFGTAPANAQVQMVIDGRVVDIVTANAAGEWQYGGSYAEGQHQLAARLLGADGQILTASSAQPFIIQGEATIGTDDGLLQLVFAAQPDGSVRTAARDVDGYLIDGPAIHLVLDSSYSMRLNLTGDTRLEVTNPESRIGIAQQTLQTALSSLPEGVPISIRAFGHIENTAETTCQTALELPSQPLVHESALGTLATIRPQYLTDTPLAESLAAAAEDLAGVNRKVIIVLVTDGEENCGGDPTVAVQKLIDAGLDFQLDVVGLAIGDAEAQALLQSLAELGGGRYFDAQSADALTTALADSLLTPYQVLDENGELVATGVVGGQPLRLPAGRDRAEVLSAEPRSFNLIVRTGRTAFEMIE
ncbi:MAG TPA: VWA domain-containing protein, partial [Anaerolineae bacterium]|nr:VWA domain-containing protein [Anaerolineae bacterium]